MTNEDIAKVLSGIKLTLPKYAPPEITPQLCVMWLSTLKEFSDEQIRKSFFIAMQNLTEFPTPATIKRICLGSIQTYEEIGIDIAARIESAISRVGSGRYLGKDQLEKHREKLLEHVGEIGMEVIRLVGGWERLCETVYDELPSLRKQLREVTATTSKRVYTTGQNEIPKFPLSKEKPKLLQEALDLVCKTRA